MKRLNVCLLGLLGAFAASATIPGEVKAASIPAISGSSFFPGEAGCFVKTAFSNRVQNTCVAPGRTWLMPLTLTATGVTNFRASAVGAGGAATCRVVLRSNADVSVFFGAATGVAGTDVLLGSPNVPSVSTTGHVDCLLAPSGMAMSAVRW